MQACIERKWSPRSYGDYAREYDYDPRTEITQQFFKTVQNKMHFAAHGHTAAEVIFDRANAEKDFMGLTSWRGAMPTKHEAELFSS